MRVLVCAATSVEARACRAGIARAGREAEIEVLQTGIGQKAAESALRDWLAAAGATRVSQAAAAGASVPELIVSSGFAGARVGALEIGTWICAKTIAAAGRETLSTARRAADNFWRSNLSWAPVACLTVDEVLSAVDQPVGDAQVVDMESHALARVAAEAGVPFDCVRLISDTPDKPIPKSIGLLASAGSQARARDRMKRWVSGSFGLLREPVGSAAFVARAARLPALLSDGWAVIAKLLVP